MERLGIADEMRERRETVAARLSPMARHQAFPNQYARPIPREARKDTDGALALRAQVEALEIKLADARQKIAQLNSALADLSKPIGERVNHEPRDVMVVFCECMEAFGVRLGENRWTIRELEDVARGQAHARPRMVCMWLVKRLSPASSFPKIGKIFGRRDHTTVIHALRRAPEIMSEDPVLRQVAMAVMQTFGSPTPEPNR